jgi:hypothetical protein
MKSGLSAYLVDAAHSYGVDADNTPDHTTAPALDSAAVRISGITILAVVA